MPSDTEITSAQKTYATSTELKLMQAVRNIVTAKDAWTQRSERLPRLFSSRLNWEMQPAPLSTFPPLPEP